MKRVVKTKEESTHSNDKQLSFTIPRPKKIGVTQILIIIIVIFAYLLGMLVTHISYLEQQAKGATPQTNAQTAPQAAVPDQLQAPQPTLGKQNVDIGHLPPQGDPNAKVKIIEFADLRCPFCDEFFKNTEPQIINDYVKTGKAVFYFRHYAFLGPASTTAANAAECANDQGKFWEMHDYLYQNQPDESDTSMYTTDNLTQVAGTLGMDTNQFSQCLSSTADSKNVSDDLAAGQKAGVSGTPTTFINGTPIVGAVPYAQIKAEIDKALQ